MNQRWPVMHRRSSGMGSMTALRYTGLRLSAGKHLGRVDGSSVGFEVETTLRFSVRSKPNLSTMPSFLERLGHVPHMGSGKGLGFRGFSSTHSDRSSLGLYSLSRRQLRCQKAGGRSSRLQPFYLHGWPSIPGCSFLVRGISSRILGRALNPVLTAECVAPSRDEASVDDASVDEDGLSKVTLSYNYAEEIVWEETISSTKSSPDKVEYSSVRRSVSESSWEESKEEHKVAAEAHVDPTIIVFDIETTGFLKSGSKIVELACRDLAGGDRSTLETLVNPFQPVPLQSTAVHKITTEMVNRDDIPSWSVVMTAFVDFVESRRRGNGKVILVAHNGRRFDVPFIMKECYECSMAIPSHWYFVDTIDLAKTMLKRRFGKTKLYNLQYLYYDCYDLPRLKDAHRAGVDVDMLACVFGKLLMDLEMPVSELLDQAFKATDIELKPDLLLRENNDRYSSYGGYGTGMPQLNTTSGTRLPNGAGRGEDAGSAARFDYGGRQGEQH
ncbi:hypothetical protein M758_8G128500 [Ceratodon purpureus]|nr:hypothetical protein M758_8G128500 [Ceratodon purpureus]